MIDGAGAPAAGAELFSSGTPRATLLSRLHEPVDRGDRLDVAARLTTVVAGLAVLAALPLDLFVVFFDRAERQGYRVTAWGSVTRIGTGLDLGFQGPVYGYLFATVAAIVVLAAWSFPRCATLALAVLAGGAGILVTQMWSLLSQDGSHGTIGPFLPVLVGAVAFACLVRFAAWARRA